MEQIPEDRIVKDREAWGHKESDTTERLNNISSNQSEERPYAESETEYGPAELPGKTSASASSSSKGQIRKAADQERSCQETLRQD